MSDSEIKTFTYNLIGDSLSIALENLFEAVNLERECRGLRLSASSVQVEVNKRKLRRAQHHQNRCSRVSILYSVIALEHVTFEALCKLDKAGDTNLTERQGTVWRRSPHTQLVQIKDLKKAILYLLSRGEIQDANCACKTRASSQTVHSYLEEGLKIRNGFVHGVSSQREIELVPRGQPRVISDRGGKKIVEQEMTATTKSQTITSFSQAVNRLKSSGVFNCSHADGDPNHVCLSMASSFCNYGFDLVHVLAKHYGIRVSIVFYDSDGNRVITTNTTEEAIGGDYDIKIEFSANAVKNYLDTQLASASTTAE